MKTLLQILFFFLLVSQIIFAQDTWVQQNSGITDWLYGVSFANEAVGWAVGANGKVLKTTDGGLNWNQKTSPTGYNLKAVAFVDTNTGWAVGVFSGSLNGGIYKTTNGGTTWSTQLNISNYEFNSVFFITATTGYAVGGGGTIYKTTNGGTNWIAKSSGTTSALYSVFFYSSSLGFIGGANNTIRKTTDGGETWVSSNSGSGGSTIWSIYFTSENVGFSVGPYCINKTTNGGTTWTQQTNPTSTYYSVKFVDSTTGWICGYSSIILKTTDGGATWIDKQVATTTYLSSLHFPTPDVGYCVGVGGTILRYGAPVWNKNLNISDAGTQSEIMTFGQLDKATDSLDTSIGEYELPPVPPTGVFDARFNLPIVPSIGSLIDYRSSTDTSIVWNMTFQPSISGYPITFDWSEGNFPTSGNFFLKDHFGLVNVNMRTHNSYTLTNPGINSLKIEFARTVTLPVNVLQGWNILSVPVTTLDMTANILFPGATTNFFGYNSGYEIVNTLENSKGYWAKFGSNQTYQIEGNLVDPPDVIVNNNWNIIGPFDFDVPVSNITSSPPNIIATLFFGFNNGYQIADTLKIGKGYWVRVNESGTLSLNNLLKRSLDRNVETAMVEVSFSITDSAGGTSILKAGVDPIGTDSLDQLLGEYELPPIPPTGVFDARFNLPNSTISTLTDIREGTDAGGFEREHQIQYQVGDGTEIIINYDFGNYTHEQVKGRLQDIVTGTFIDTMISGSGSYTVTNPSVINKLKLTMIYGALVSVEDEVNIPKEFTLEQNFPNPFNPTTKINYALPQSAFVELKVYNVLGQEIVTIVNSEKPAGYYEVDFNASNLSSGVYIYKLQAGDYVNSKKMILIK